MFFDFKNLNDTQDNINITGKTASQSIDVISQALTSEEYDYLEEILYSPKVEILTTDRYSVVSNKDWATVKVLDGRTNKSSKALSQYLPVRIQLPTLYTQTS